MRTRLWSLGFGVLVMGLLAMPAGVRAADEDVPGPIDSLSDLQDTGKMLFKMADVNNDNQISEREATDAGNLLVGGFFFRADANGDGVVSKEEGQQALNAFMRQKPLLRIVFERAKKPGSAQPGQRAQAGQPNAPVQDAAQGLMTVLDTNGDGQLQATELRQAVLSGVQGLYATADTNRDGQMTPDELNASVVGMGRTIAQASFQAADSDGNGSLSQEEFNKSIIEPANAIFRIVDANGDSQLSQQEAQSAQRVVFNQIRLLNVPEASNSLGNRIERAAQPGTAPAFGSPAPGSTTPRRAPRATQPQPRPAQPRPAQPRPVAPATPAPATQPPR